MEIIYKMLKDVERLRQDVMREINEIGANDQTTKKTTVYPMAKIEPLMVEGYPVFRFGYEGLLPIFIEDDYEYLSMIRNYYFRATLDSYDFKRFRLPVMKEVVVIFVQYFLNKKIGDLNNRNKKYIQDAIRQTRLFGDDDWQNVWNMDIGFLDNEKDHIQVYVVERKNLSSFMGYLMKYHEKLKDGTNYLPTKAEYEKYFANEK
ncbi:hypothetical protein [Virgibacillus proomii]|uniref:hypothetical protein n=1 Tax=Virgibacillus proomii TaxID=84407 RepID=UPI000985AEAB|nr:hypothetical protein [Virgibacillus proomii]